MEHTKPVIETLINTAALALTSLGVVSLTTNEGSYYGLVLITFGMILEFMKYLGRSKDLW